MSKPKKMPAEYVGRDLAPLIAAAEREPSEHGTEVLIINARFADAIEVALNTLRAEGYAAGSAAESAHTVTARASEATQRERAETAERAAMELRAAVAELRAAEEAAIVASGRATDAANLRVCNARTKVDALLAAPRAEAPLRDPIYQGTVCLAPKCGREKRRGVDYCDACRADEAREVEEARASLRADAQPSQPGDVRAWGERVAREAYRLGEDHASSYERGGGVRRLDAKAMERIFDEASPAPQSAMPEAAYGIRCAMLARAEPDLPSESVAFQASLPGRVISAPAAPQPAPSETVAMAIAELTELSTASAHLFQRDMSNAYANAAAIVRRHLSASGEATAERERALVRRKGTVFFEALSDADCDAIREAVRS